MRAGREIVLRKITLTLLLAYVIAIPCGGIFHRLFHYFAHSKIHGYTQLIDALLTDPHNHRKALKTANSFNGSQVTSDVVECSLQKFLSYLDHSNLLKAPSLSVIPSEEIKIANNIFLDRQLSHSFDFQAAEARGPPFYLSPKVTQ